MCLRFLAEFILSHRRARNDRGEGQTMMVRQAHHELGIEGLICRGFRSDDALLIGLRWVKPNRRGVPLNL